MAAIPLGDVERVAALWIGRLGDFLIATPFLHALRERFPQARITAIVGERGREAAELCPGVDEILTLHKLARPLANLRLAAALLRGRYDLLVDLNSAFSRASTAVAWLARAKVKLAFARGAGNGVFTHTVAAPAETEHMLDRYARLAGAIGAPYRPKLRARVPEPGGSAGRETMRRLREAAPAGARLVLIHPGNFKKVENRWPEEKFISLTDRLLQRGGCAVAYLAGPGEEEPVRNIVERCGHEIPVVGPMSLAALAGALSETDLLIVNATGTAHLAAALEVPTFTFLSRYTKAVWMPREGPHHSVVSPSWESCRETGVDEAWSALVAALDVLPRRLAKTER